MFKKLIIPTILAGGLFCVGHTQAHADSIDFETLAQKAQANSIDINTKPIQKGAYDYNFTRNGINYHFYSDGVHFGYEWHDTKQENPTQDHLTQNPNATKLIDKQQDLFDKNVVYTKERDYTENLPTNTTQQKQNEDYVLNRFNENKSKDNGSVKEQFLANGGTEAMWQSIVLPESSGNPNASNGQYTGLFQTNQPSFNASNSVAQQTKGALNYAKERYGSLDNAIAFRQSNGWW